MVSYGLIVCDNRRNFLKQLNDNLEIVNGKATRPISGANLGVEGAAGTAIDWVGKVIELPSRLGYNLVFENQKDHIWWFVFNDITHELIASKKKQFISPPLLSFPGEILLTLHHQNNFVFTF